MNTLRLRHTLILLVLCAFWFWQAGGTRLFAQGIIIDPPPGGPVEPPLWPLPRDEISIELHQVDAVIDGPVAQVHLTQIFRNDSGRTVEGVYLFPLPAEAAISDFQMTVDGKTLEGKLLDKAEARRIYEEIVRRQRDPALLEYVGRNLFQASVFPIPAGARRKLELSYTQLLPQRAGLYQFTYPLRTQQYSSRPVETLAINLELRNQPGLRTIYSPNYNINIVRSGNDQAQIGYETSQAAPESDFSLFFGTDIKSVGLNLLSYKPAGEDGYFVLLAAPGSEVSVQQVIARDVLLVLDVSGSMQGEKMEQARKAAHFVIDQLNPADHFNLVSFSTGARLWQVALTQADPSARQAAHAWIDQLQASGSTDINRALLEALAQFPASHNGTTRPAYLLFMTDGLPTGGETDAQRIVDNALNNLPAGQQVRLFSFGVGYDVNTDLLATLSQELGGRSSYVTPGQRIDEVIGDFYSTISTPVLSNAQLDLGKNVLIDEVYPFPLPDLFAGEQLVVVGRYRRGGTVTVTLRGQVNGEKLTYLFPGQTLVSSGGEAFVARLWATRKIGVLLAQARQSGASQEVIDEIVKLSLDYGIVTPYTSYLVQEPGLVQEPPANHQDSGGAAPMDATAQAETKAAVEGAAYAAASGEEAVVAAKVRDELQNAVQVAENHAVRFVAGRSFSQQGVVITPAGVQLPLWVDTRFTAKMQVTTVSFGGDCYFKLAARPELTQWLALSSELLIVLDDDHALRITTATVGANADKIAGCPTDLPKN